MSTYTLVDLFRDRENSILLLIPQEALDVRVRDRVQRLKCLFRAQGVQFLTDLGQVDAFGPQVDVAVNKEEGIV